MRARVSERTGYLFPRGGEHRRYPRVQTRSSRDYLPGSQVRANLRTRGALVRGRVYPDIVKLDVTLA